MSSIHYITVLKCANCKLVTNVIPCKKMEIAEHHLVDAQMMMNSPQETWMDAVDICQRCGEDNFLDVHLFKEIQPEEEMDRLENAALLADMEEE